MAFGEPDGPLWPTYSVTFQHKEITGSSPVQFTLNRSRGDENTDDADTAFQRFIDLINASDDFVFIEANKQHSYQQRVTPTS